jgi:pre-rRNA-processing protein IPI3
VWPLGREQASLRCFAPEQLSSLAACGPLLASGSASGALWLWHAPSGRLLRTWGGHTRAVSALCWSADGSFLLSGSEDTLVAAWSLSRLACGLNDGAASAATAWPPSALYSWSEHSLGVVSLAAGCAVGSPLVVSASLDATVRVWTLAGGSLLRTLRLPCPLSALCLDGCDRTLFAGGADGRIFAAPLAGGGSGDGAGEAAFSLAGHTRSVRSLAASADGRHLLSGSDDGSLRVWCLASRQCLRSLAHARACAAPVVALLLVPRATVGAQGGRDAPASPIAPLAKFLQDAQNAGKPWEGPPVLLRAAAEQAVAEQPEAHSVSVSPEAELGALRAQLAEARGEAQRWQALHSQLRSLVADQ